MNQFHRLIMKPLYWVSLILIIIASSGISTQTASADPLTWHMTGSLAQGRSCAHIHIITKRKSPGCWWFNSLGMMNSAKFMTRQQDYGMRQIA